MFRFRYKPEPDSGIKSVTFPMETVPLATQHPILMVWDGSASSKNKY